jgi:small conductance mechanosensitive channel
VILIVTWIISRILGTFILKAAGKLSSKVAGQARRIVTLAVWLIGILIGLDYLGLDLTTLLVILTLGGLTIVIAIRDILSNMASHEVITTYRLFKIGDWIQVGKFFGRVVDITWMDTILMTPDNETIHISNSKMTKSIVINRTASGETRISVSLTVDDTLDFSEVEKILLEISAELAEELAPDSKPEVRVTNIDNRSIKVALLLKIHNPAKSEFIASEVRKRAKMRLDKIRRRTA